MSNTPESVPYEVFSKWPPSIKEAFLAIEKRLTNQEELEKQIDKLKADKYQLTLIGMKLAKDVARHVHHNPVTPFYITCEQLKACFVGFEEALKYHGLGGNEYLDA